jgi:hypothetical protein
MIAKTVKPIWHTLLFFLTINVFAYGLDLPTTYSFFTAGDPKESAGFSFLLTRQRAETRTKAGITIPGPFLFEEIIVEAGEVIEAEIVILDQGFNVDEIFIPSVRIHYKDKYSFALMGRTDENRLIATFDFYELWKWFQNLSPHPGQVSLAVSGEGYGQDGAVFFFSGETMINLKGSYDVRAIEILSPDFLILPSEETLSYEFKLVDQKGSPLYGARWKLAEDLLGVDLDEKTGVLTAKISAAGKSISVEAVLESQGRFHSDRVTVKLMQCPDNELSDSDSEDEDEKDDGSQLKNEDDELHTEIDPGDSDIDTDLETDFGEEGNDQS